MVQASYKILLDWSVIILIKHNRRMPKRVWKVAVSQGRRSVRLCRAREREEYSLDIGYAYYTLQMHPLTPRRSKRIM